MIDTTKLEPGDVSRWLQDLNTATMELSTCAAEGSAPYPNIERVDLIKSGLSSAIYDSLSEISKDMDKMIKAVSQYVTDMVTIDGQSAAEAGIGADAGGTVPIEPGGGGNGPSGGPGGPGGSGGGPVDPGEMPPLPDPELTDPDPWSSPLAAFGEAIAENIGSMMDLLNEIAALLGVTLEALLTEPQYKDKLEEILKSSETLVQMAELANFETPEAMQTWLRAIYNGEEVANISTPIMDFARMRLDSIAKAKGITTEKLVNNTDFAKELQSTVMGYGKLNKFISMIEGKSQQVIENIYHGMVPEAYGFKKENLKKFKDSLEKLAKDNKMDVTELLKPENANKVKSAFDTLDPTKTLSAIYGDAPGATTQTVANNLYQAANLATSTPTSNASTGV